MSLSKNDQAIIKNLINEAFKSHWEDNCRPHEERLAKTEKQLVIIFENGLKAKIQEAIDGVKELKKNRWVMPVAVVGSILTTYLLDKLF